MGLLEKDPVVIGGSVPTASNHEDITDPPTLTNVDSTLIVVPDTDGILAYNKNSDSTHSWKVTVPSTTFSGGFAFYVNFGTTYENSKGEPVAPHVHMHNETLGTTAYITNITPSGYSVNLPPLTSSTITRLRMSVKQPT